jgi:hypothetical protein
LASIFHFRDAVILGPKKNKVSPLAPCFLTGVGGNTLLMAASIAASSVSMSMPIAP